MSNAEKTLVTVPTYNEMENLPLLVEAIFRYLPEADHVGDRRQFAGRHRRVVR